MRFLRQLCQLWFWNRWQTEWERCEIFGAYGPSAAHVLIWAQPKLSLPSTVCFPSSRFICDGLDLMLYTFVQLFLFSLIENGLPDGSAWMGSLDCQEIAALTQTDLVLLSHTLPHKVTLLSHEGSWAHVYTYTVYTYCVYLLQIDIRQIHTMLLFPDHTWFCIWNISGTK